MVESLLKDVVLMPDNFIVFNKISDHVDEP